MNTTHKLAALSVAAMTMAGNVFAAEGQDQWQFGVTLPVWVAGINGDATVNGVQRNVDLSFNDLKDHLDTAIGLGFDAHKGKLGFYGGFGYQKYSAGGGLGGGAHVDANLKFLVADAGLSYCLVKVDEENPFILEGTLGLRYWYTKTEIKFQDQGSVVWSGSHDRDLVDPMIGLRGSKYFTEKLHFDFSGDIGGFGISDNQADIDWSAAALLSYDFAKWFTLSGGYKAVGLDKSTGSGASENGLNIVFNGALIAAKFKF